MARRRFYIFERAYIDFVKRGRAAAAWVTGFSRNARAFFWTGPGSKIIDVALQVSILLVAVALCGFYVNFELDQGRSIGLATIGVCAVILIFALIGLWGWKAPVHFLARGFTVVFIAALQIGVWAIAALVIAPFFLAYLAALVLWTGLSAFIFLPVRAAEEIWLLIRGIAYRCPYDGCSEGGLPIHICSCGEEYADLVPSFFGIFYHRCRHGDSTVKLPTMDILGRSKLPRLCKACKRPLLHSSIGMLQEFPISVIGIEGSGKTTFVTQGVRSLARRILQIPEAKVRFDSKDQEIGFKRDIGTLDRGGTLPKTSGEVIQALGLAVQVPKRLKCLLYLYDSPGEHFATMQRFGQKRVIKHLRGIILLVDPADIRGINGSGVSAFSDLVAVLISGVESQRLAFNAHDQCEVPVAVVLGKADSLPADQYPFLSGLTPNGGAVSERERSDRCRAALIKLGEGNSVRALDQRFANIRYFACSALGRAPDPKNKQAFRPDGVAEPFCWLLNLN